MAHHLEALDWQRRIVQLQTLIGGKSPHPQTFLVGGSALAVPWGGPAPALPGEHPAQIDRRSPTALSTEGLALMSTIVAEAKAFVDEVYVPDVLAIARAYPERAARIGRGPGNFLAFGEFPLDDGDDPRLLLPRGRIMDGDLTRPDSVAQLSVAETVAHSWYHDDGAGPVHPAHGRTDPEYAGADAALHHPRRLGALQLAEGAALRRASRWRSGRSPGCSSPTAEGRTDVRDRVDDVFARLGLGFDALFEHARPDDRPGRSRPSSSSTSSTAGSASSEPTLAAGDLAVVDLSRWEPATWPSAATGWSLGRGSAGRCRALGLDRRRTGRRLPDRRRDHLERLAARRRRRDAARSRQALIGTPVADPDRPVEILRTVHSFDPCLACAVHAARPVRRRPGQRPRAPRRHGDDRRRRAPIGSSAWPRRARGRRAARASPTRAAGGLYIWQLPVRITHWVTAFCIVILSLTGAVHRRSRSSSRPAARS